MEKLFEFLLSGCWHKWEIREEFIVHEGPDKKGLPLGKAYMCQCTKCGKPKRFNLY